MIRYQKNPKQSQSIIMVDGRQYPAKYIGKGQYSRVFRVGDRVIYYTRGDCSKEVMAQLQQDRMMHLPEIIRHDNIYSSRGMEWYVFSSPWYRDVRKSDTSAYTLMRKILDVNNHFSFLISGEKLLDIERMQAFEVYVRGKVPHSVSKALREIIDVSSNCGNNVGFDLHKKNFGVNEYGTLIFRDPVYVRE
jgi:hypothetical protein